MSASTTLGRSFTVLLTVLCFLLLLGVIYPGQISGLSTQDTCVGIGGWPCGYTGPFSGYYYAGYATMGCIPTVPNGTCVVPLIALEASYLVIRNEPYVIDWANVSFPWSGHIADGDAISIAGLLTPIFYNKTAGSTYMIYYSNTKGIWNPQPSLAIQNATLSTQSVNSTCTTTLTFTVSGPPNVVWSMPMIPTGACYTIINTAEQQPHTPDDVNNPTWPIVLAASGACIIALGIFVLLRRQGKKRQTQNHAND